MRHTKEIAALLLAGSLFFCLGAGGRVKKDVTVEGVEVGGMTYGEAAEAVREQIAKTLPPLKILSPAGEFTFSDELSFTDNAVSLLRRAKSGDSLRVRVTRTWADAEAALQAICEKNALPARDAEFTFSDAGFEYTAEEIGRSCDYGTLLREVTAALSDGGTEVRLRTEEVLPAVTERDLRERTKKLASFTTRFDGDNLPRSRNIALAAQKISGAVLEAGESFSFNGTVGRRTEENGFETAKVIFEGQFVDGVGGGVCQASTTLFGAALRAGLKITESRPHSLSVSYVPPSLDAMVSEYSDLKFENPYDFPVYILARTGKNSVTFEIFGKPNGLVYRTESVVLFRLPPPPAIVTEGEEEETVRAEKEGVGSESWLLVYQDGQLLSRTLIRRDTYAVVQGIYVKKAPPEVPSEAQNSPPSVKIF